MADYTETFTDTDTSTREPDITSDTSDNSEPVTEDSVDVTEDTDNSNDAGQTEDNSSDISESDDNNSSEELILGKYKSYEDLENAHKSLESKLGQYQTEKKQELDSIQKQKDEEVKYYKDLARQYGFDSHYDAKKQAEINNVYSKYAQEQMGLLNKYSNYSNSENATDLLNKYMHSATTGDTVGMQLNLQDFLSTLPSLQASMYTRDLMDLDNKVRYEVQNLTQAIEMQEYEDWEKSKNEFYETNQEVLGNELNKQIINKFYNSEITTVEDVLNLVMQVRQDEQKIGEQKAKMIQENKKAKSKMTSVNDKKSMPENLVSNADKNYTINELLQLEKDNPTAFDAWVKGS